MEPHLPALHSASQTGSKAGGCQGKEDLSGGGVVLSRRHKGHAARQSVPGDQ